MPVQGKTLQARTAYDQQQKDVRYIRGGTESNQRNTQRDRQREKIEQVLFNTRTVLFVQIGQDVLLCGAVRPEINGQARKKKGPAIPPK